MGVLQPQIPHDLLHLHFCVHLQFSGRRHIIGRGRRCATDGAARRGSVRHSSPASACRRSIQTPAGRVRQVNTHHVNAFRHPPSPQVVQPLERAESNRAIQKMEIKRSGSKES